MVLMFELTVSALADSIIRERCAGEGIDASHYHDSVTRFLLGQHERMPDYLRLPLQVLTLVFDSWALPRNGHPFHRLTHERRWRQICAWKRSRVGKFRDLIKFYESLTILAFYSEVYGTTDSPWVSRKQPEVLNDSPFHAA